MNSENYNNFINAINLLSFFLAVENLQENRMQSEQNDVQAANQSQADYLIKELGKRFEEQDKVLQDIVTRLDRIENNRGT